MVKGFRYMRWCKRCGKHKEVLARNSKICDGCKKRK